MGDGPGYVIEEDIVDSRRPAPSKRGRKSNAERRRLQQEKDRGEGESPKKKFMRLDLLIFISAPAIMKG